MIDVQEMKEIAAFNRIVKDTPASSRASFTKSLGQAQLVITRANKKYFVSYRTDLYYGGVHGDYEVVEKPKRLKELLSGFLEAHIDDNVFKELIHDLKKSTVKSEYKIAKGSEWLRYDW